MFRSLSFTVISTTMLGSASARFLAKTEALNDFVEAMIKHEKHCVEEMLKKMAATFYTDKYWEQKAKKTAKWATSNDEGKYLLECFKDSIAENI